MHLVSIQSKEENDFIRKQIQEGEFINKTHNTNQFKHRKILKLK